jgi:hypothetical protein
MATIIRLNSHGDGTAAEFRRGVPGNRIEKRRGQASLIASSFTDMTAPAHRDIGVADLH